jgi:predicted ATPase
MRALVSAPSAPGAWATIAPMLTRLHIKGFKNFQDVDLQFGLFTCIAGRNGVGKSPQTLLAGVNASSHPTALAARREMQSWRFLQLEPSALRSPDDFRDSARFGPTGAHLPNALMRICPMRSCALAAMPRWPTSWRS